jgi:hypothetical protein
MRASRPSLRKAPTRASTDRVRLQPANCCLWQCLVSGRLALLTVAGLTSMTNATFAPPLNLGRQCGGTL